MEPASVDVSSHPSAEARPINVALLAASLVVAVLAAYANTFRVPFLLDDSASIIENASIRDLTRLDVVLAPPSNSGTGGRPISNLIFAINYAFGGLNVGGYHVVNILIHVAASLLLFGLARRTFELPRLRGRFSPRSATIIAFGIAFIWALHPLQTESVTYIAQRTESLMGMFYVATLYGYARGVLGSKGWFGLAIVACILGMATKEVMVTAPVVVLLYDHAFIGGSFRAAWQARRGILAALAATWIPLLFLLADVQERGVGYASVTWWQYALTESRAILLYLRLALWPAPLVFDYGTAITKTLGEGWPHLLGLGTVTTVALFAWKRVPMIGFFAVSVLIILAPASSVVPVPGQTVAEHRMYLPLVGIVVLAVLAAQRWCGRHLLTVVGTLGLLCAVATVVRNRTYATAISIWTDTAEKAPQNARAHAALGAARLEKGEIDRAVASLQRALQINPAFAEVHNNLATALIDLNRPQDAVPHFTAALQLRPDLASTRYNFGNTLLALGRPAEAIAQHEQALILQPNFPEAACGLGNALFAVGRYQDAIQRYREALRRQPGFVAAHYGLANALAQIGLGADAIPHYQATVRAVPNSVEAHFNLGNVLLELKRPAEAIAHYETALRHQPDFADAHNNLANALALSGRIPEALPHYEAALKIQPDFAAARANLEALRNRAPRSTK